MSHTRSLFVQKRAGGTFAQDFVAVAPVLSYAAPFAADGNALVKGTITIDGAPYILDNRWATLGYDIAKSMLSVAMKDGTIHKASILSDIHGNSRGVGSEPGFVLYLNGSDAAIALAEEFSLVNTETVTVGRYNDVTVTHENAIMMTLELATELQGGAFSKITGLPRDNELPDRTDAYNPSLTDLIAIVRSTGELPERAQQTRVTGNQDFLKKFGAQIQPQTRGRRRY